jgi:hypothetical protein
MRSIQLLSLAAAVTLAGSSVGSAAPIVVVNDGFEYADQAAFEAAWAPIGTVAPLSTTLDSTRFASGAKSATVPVTTATGQARNRLTFADIAAPSSSTSVTWSFDFYDSQTAAATTGAPSRNYSNLQDTTAPGSTNQLISMGLNNNQTGANSGGQFYMARILGYTVPTTADPDGGATETVGGAGAYFKLNDFAVGGRTTGWHNLKVVMSSDDGLSTDYAFYVDSVLAELVSNVGTAASFRQFDNIAIGSGVTNGGTDAGFDNMFLQTNTVVPEPTTLAALGASSLLLGRRRRA